MISNKPCLCALYAVCVYASCERPFRAYLYADTRRYYYAQLKIYTIMWVAESQIMECVLLKLLSIKYIWFVYVSEMYQFWSWKFWIFYGFFVFFMNFPNLVEGTSTLDQSHLGTSLFFKIEKFKLIRKNSSTRIPGSQSELFQSEKKTLGRSKKNASDFLPPCVSLQMSRQ